MTDGKTDFTGQILPFDRSQIRGIHEKHTKIRCLVSYQTPFLFFISLHTQIPQQTSTYISIRSFLSFILPAATLITTQEMTPMAMSDRNSDGKSGQKIS